MAPASPPLNPSLPINQFISLFALKLYRTSNIYLVIYAFFAKYLVTG
jgi:hypothetical protein